MKWLEKTMKPWAASFLLLLGAVGAMAQPEVVPIHEWPAASTAAMVDELLIQRSPFTADTTQRLTLLQLIGVYFPSGTTPPASGCNETAEHWTRFFVDTDADASQHLLLCTDADTWEPVGGSGSGSGTGDIESVGECLTGACFSGETMVTSATPAGGALGGTYPNPTVDDDGHAHTGATISALDAADITTGTLVHERGGLEADVSAFGGLVRIAGGATSAVTSLSGLNTALGSSIADGPHTTDTDDQDASEVPFTPAGNLEAEDVQAALEELDAEDADTTCLDAGVTCNFAGSASEGGPATTATALAANGANCSAGNYPLGVDASGAAESCTADDDVPDVGEVDDTALAAGAVDGGNGGEIADNSVTADDLAATQTFADGDLLDLSAINGSGTSEGLKLPQATSCTSSTAEGQVCWDTDDNRPYFGNSSSSLPVSKVFNDLLDCTAATGGLSGDLCYEWDSDTLYSCQPSSGPCDTAGEWVLTGDGGGGAVAPADMDDADFGDWTCAAGVCTLDADSVSAAELNATGVESELEAVLEVGQLQGGLAADQVDTITDIAAALKSGSDATLITGTIATTNAVLTVDANDDLVEQGLTWNITAATCTGDGNGGALTVNGSNQIVCSADDGGGGSVPTRDFYWAAASLQPLEHAADHIAPISLAQGTNVDALRRVFDDSTDECAGGTFAVPASVTSGNVTFSLWWSSATATTGNVIWDVRHSSGQAEGVSWDTALTTVTAAADAVQGTVKQLTLTTWTETVSNLAWAAGDVVSFEVCRDADNASDTLVGDAAMLGFQIAVPRA